MRTKQCIRQPNALFSEDQSVPGREARLQIAHACERAEKVETSRGVALGPSAKKNVEARMGPNVDEVPVVHPRAPDTVLVDSKPERADEVQARGRRSAQQRHAPGLWG